MLTFGGVASAGIFDDGAKTVLDLAALDSVFDKSKITQVLDDVVACGTQGDNTVAKFEQSYRDIASKVGVSLADGSDPEKAFSATHESKTSRCPYVYTLAKAIYDVGEGLACRMKVVKTPRCCTLRLAHCTWHTAPSTLHLAHGTWHTGTLQCTG